MAATEPDRFELVCTSGAQGKCVRFGYHPWQSATMRERHNACIRMVRADYCGDGRSWTLDGTRIDVWDHAGIQKPDTLADPAFLFEAGWTPRGAACVARTRIPGKLALEALRAMCSHLLAGPDCNEILARERGALLFNRSR